LKIGAIHRNRFAARVTDLLGMASLPELVAAIEPLLRIRENMRAERKAFDRSFAALSRQDEVTRRLMTIPGVGPVTSLAFKATIDDTDRFITSKALGAHLGLTPRVYQFQGHQCLRVLEHPHSLQGVFEDGDDFGIEQQADEEGRPDRDGGTEQGRAQIVDVFPEGLARAAVFRIQLGIVGGHPLSFPSAFSARKLW
jgi:hypothetical protein